MARSKVLDFLTEIVDGLYIIYKQATIKDPCKKCLIQPCCTALCGDKDYVNRIMHPWSYKAGKRMAIVLIISNIMAISAVIIALFRQIL